MRKGGGREEEAREATETVKCRLGLAPRRSVWTDRRSIIQMDVLTTHQRSLPDRMPQPPSAPLSLNDIESSVELSVITVAANNLYGTLVLY
ncbi:hypothetical protein LSTR_LSTR005325 [Laodelphax striatellus]|uniref:Uncharacterized protein n=1 Tax=Laodelphax striatellus TaxID=195883 RepID=A0A482X806_LAOST|nr:hypothetical protein LSTR_LSTR005325 [Laodelphax striatellus]